MATTQEIFDHHVAGFAERNVEMVLEDYTDDSLLISNGSTFEGLDGIRTFMTELFTELPKDCHFDLTGCIVRDRYVYITWNAESDRVKYEFVTDTFLIENDKISLQTIGAVKSAK